MKQELQTQDKWKSSSVIEEISNMKQLCTALMETPHYKRMGAEGIFAIVQKAKALNINPIDALNGGLYCVNGKVEMSSHMMIQLCRQAGHSITKDKRSDDTICILHGKRKDNGDTWTESFSIDDAKRAGIYKNTWEKFPRNMLFARALSNLARQLFPDAIKGCYVEGEIVPMSEEIPPTPESKAIQPSKAEPTLTWEQVEYLESRLAGEETLYSSLLDWVERNCGTRDLSYLPLETYTKIIERLDMREVHEPQPA